MKKNYAKTMMLALFIWAGAQFNGLAQFNCLPSGITFDQQSQIDSFAINFPGCLNVTGHVLIFPATPGAITSLAGLSQLQSIGSQLWINDNTGLTSFAGLENLTMIGSHLRIRYNNNITSLSGLDGVTTIGGELDISDNQILNSLDGLDSLTSVGSNFTLANNSLLVDLDGLTALTALGGYLSITNDTLLPSLSGLDNIDHTTITQLQISNNKYLTMCVIKSICDFLAIPSNFASIGGNAFGCWSRSQVENGCLSLGIEDAGKETIQVYPNPASDVVAVSGFGHEKVLIRVMDKQGRLLIEKKSGNGLLDIRHLAKGVYLVTVQTEAGNYTRQLIKN